MSDFEQRFIAAVERLEADIVAFERTRLSMEAACASLRARLAAIDTLLAAQPPSWSASTPPGAERFLLDGGAAGEPG